MVGWRVRRRLFLYYNDGKRITRGGSMSNAGMRYYTYSETFGSICCSHGVAVAPLPLLCSVHSLAMALLVRFHILMLRHGALVRKDQVGPAVNSQECPPASREKRKMGKMDGWRVEGECWTRPQGQRGLQSYSVGQG